MAWTDNRSNEELRIQSGNIIALKDGDSEWEVPAKLADQKLSRKSKEINGVYVDGFEWSKRGSTASGVNAVFTQMSKTFMDRMDVLDGKIVQFILYNGIGDDGNMQAMYAPEAEVIVDADIDLKGDTPQYIPVMFKFQPQTEMPAVTPSTGFPSELGFVGAVEVTGTNPFYVIVEEESEG